MIRKILGSATIGILLVGCKFDPNKTKLQYMPDMADTPVVKAQREYLDPPEGSVAADAILYPKTAQESGELLKNPFAQLQEVTPVLNEGKHLYQTFCLPCHGENAKGDGPITDKFPKPRDITTEADRNQKDGFFFHVITHGSASQIMPKYGDKISPNERWKIVLYLRTLQKAEG